MLLIAYLRDIRLVRHQLDDPYLLDVVYVIRTELRCGLTATEVRTGETNTGQLFIAMNWAAGLEPKIQLATLTRH